MWLWNLRSLCLHILLFALYRQMTMDKYVKIKRIGEGSFGVAYLARCKDGKDRGKQVVLKEINMTRVSWRFGFHCMSYCRLCRDKSYHMLSVRSVSCFRYCYRWEMISSLFRSKSTILLQLLCWKVGYVHIFCTDLQYSSSDCEVRVCAVYKSSFTYLSILFHIHGTIHDAYSTLDIQQFW